MKDGGNLAQEFVEESSLPEAPVRPIPSHDDFDSGELVSSTMRRVLILFPFLI